MYIYIYMHVYVHIFECLDSLDMLLLAGGPALQVVLKAQPAELDSKQVAELTEALEEGRALLVILVICINTILWPFEDYTKLWLFQGVSTLYER